MSPITGTPGGSSSGACPTLGAGTCAPACTTRVGRGGRMRACAAAAACEEQPITRVGSAEAQLSSQFGSGTACCHQKTRSPIPASTAAGAP